MPDTIRSRADLLALLADNTAGDISEQDLRDVLVSVMFPQLLCCGRLTLTSGVPVTTADVTGAGTVYFCKYEGNVIGLYDGTSWIPRTFTQVSLSLASGHADATNYDVFAYDNAGSVALESLAWTNATTRATGLTDQDGVWCKTGDLTRRYLGSFRTTSSTTTEDSGGGTTSQVGGKRFLFNAGKRKERTLRVQDETDSWSYTTGTIRQANAAPGNKVEVLIGLAEDPVKIKLLAVMESKGSTTSGQIGIGLDSTTAIHAQGLNPEFYNGNTGTVIGPYPAFWGGYPGIGYHYFSWNETGSTGTSSIFYGDDGGGSQSGLTGEVWA